jgi:hypothetical protein
MNERIRELAEQAGIDTTDFENCPIELYGAEQQLNKFAELIMKECFDVVINDSRFHDAKGIIQAGKGVALEHFRS